MKWLGVDLGSRWLGLAASDGARDVSATVPVAVDGERVAADAVVEWIDRGATTCVVLELGRGYVPARDTAEATRAAAVSVMHHRDTMIDIATRIRVACEARGVQCRTIAAQTWRKLARVITTDDGSRDAACRRAIALLIGEERAAALEDAHQVDAMGALLGVAEQHHREQERAARVAAKEQRTVDASEPRIRGKRTRKVSAARAARTAAGCSCRAKHSEGCPLYVAPPPPPPPMVHHCKCGRASRLACRSCAGCRAEKRTT